MRTIKTILCLAAMVIATACSGNAETTDTPNAETKQDTNQTKALVVFFSHTGENYAVGNIKVGNTKKVADLISEITGADQFEVVAEKSYDMDYDALTALAKQEQQKGELPAYKGEVENIDQYDIIFVGGPVWWGTYPQVMFTFLSQHDLNGKTLIPFTTHEGSGLGRVATDLQAQYPVATVKKGLAVRGTDAQADKARSAVEKWLNELGL